MADSEVVGHFFKFFLADTEQITDYYTPTAVKKEMRSLQVGDFKIAVL